MKRVTTTEWVDEKNNTLIRLRPNGEYSVVVANADTDVIRALRDACDDILSGPIRDNGPTPDPRRAMGMEA